MYHDREIFRLTGRLDLAALSSAVDLLARRHEVLRTFVTPGSELLQVVDDHWRGEVRAGRAARGGDRDVQLRSCVGHVTERQFDLGQRSLFRVDVLGFDADDHVLACTMHPSEE